MPGQEVRRQVGQVLLDACVAVGDGGPVDAELATAALLRLEELGAIRVTVVDTGLTESQLDEVERLLAGHVTIDVSDIVGPTLVLLKAAVAGFVAAAGTVTEEEVIFHLRQALDDALGAR